jgi:hypothetical protein
LGTKLKAGRIFHKTGFFDNTNDYYSPYSLGVDLRFSAAEIKITRRGPIFFNNFTEWMYEAYREIEKIDDSDAAREYKDGGVKKSEKEKFNRDEQIDIKDRVAQFKEFTEYMQELTGVKELAFYEDSEYLEAFGGWVIPKGDVTGYVVELNGCKVQKDGGTLGKGVGNFEVTGKGEKLIFVLKDKLREETQVLDADGGNSADAVYVEKTSYGVSVRIGNAQHRFVSGGHRQDYSRMPVERAIENAEAVISEGIRLPEKEIKKMQDKWGYGQTEHIREIEDKGEKIVYVDVYAKKLRPLSFHSIFCFVMKGILIFAYIIAPDILGLYFVSIIEIYLIP